MTDDLVARLRLISAWKTPGGPMPTEDMVNPHITCAEAADRIKQLEAALEKIARHDLQAIAVDALRPGERVPMEGKDD